MCPPYLVINAGGFYKNPIEISSQNAGARREYDSAVALTKTMMLSTAFFGAYMVDAAISKSVDARMNCEDIAMNALAMSRSNPGRLRERGVLRGGGVNQSSGVGYGGAVQVESS
jgi:hypothetical protein